MPERRNEINSSELLDCVLSHKAAHIRSYLADAGLATSGPKSVLRMRLEEHLDGSPGAALALTEYLNTIDGWGNQHIYLYKSPSGLSRQWRSRSHVDEILGRAQCKRLLNRPRPVVLPRVPTLASISWSERRLRIVWNERREWYERLAASDREDPARSLVFRAWRRHISRGTLSFDWDLASDQAMLSIQRLPSGTKYSVVRDTIAGWLRSFVDLATFEPLQLGKAIKRILASGEVRERRTNWETTRGGRATFMSSGKRSGVRNDAILQKMKAAGGADIEGRQGNMYWLPVELQLPNEVHVVLHKKDNRVAVSGEKLEREIRYVTGRIRSYCR